ncbi:hypothetical protein CC80DRAFT_157558 [Byssothecium circinans]|uniref:Uncharacterized protein n=1 Tax=Byssothecium circinans TaxID=147558 RepID=A0A6A5UME0_9PLEO|nr:hypothetical protein CC80DRAFT_157558 [Byssothecium circinans]
MWKIGKKCRRAVVYVPLRGLDILDGARIVHLLSNCPVLVVCLSLSSTTIHLCMCFEALAGGLACARKMPFFTAVRVNSSVNLAFNVIHPLARSLR